MSATADDQVSAVRGDARGIPSPRELRAELERTIVADLLGPAGCDTEQITEGNVRDL